MTLHRVCSELEIQRHLQESILKGVLSLLKKIIKLWKCLRTIFLNFSPVVEISLGSMWGRLFNEEWIFFPLVSVFQQVFGVFLESEV